MNENSLLSQEKNPAVKKKKKTRGVKFRWKLLSLHAKVIRWNSSSWANRKQVGGTVLSKRKKNKQKSVIFINLFLNFYNNFYFTSDKHVCALIDSHVYEQVRNLQFSVLVMMQYRDWPSVSPSCYSNLLRFSTLEFPILLFKQCLTKKPQQKIRVNRFFNTTWNLKRISPPKFAFIYFYSNFYLI